MCYIWTEKINNLILSEISIYVSDTFYQVVILKGNASPLMMLFFMYYYLLCLFLESFWYRWKTSFITLQSYLWFSPTQMLFFQFNYHILPELFDFKPLIRFRTKWHSVIQKTDEIFPQIGEILFMLAIILKRKYSFESNNIESCGKKTHS